jgi:hypothetical protein
MNRPAAWLRVQRHCPPTIFSCAPTPQAALSESGAHWKCLIWMLCFCMIDVTASTMVLVMGSACLLDLFLFSRSVPAHRRLQVLSSRLRMPPFQLLLFAVMLVVNVALQHSLVEADARPFALNILILHASILLWAYWTAPDTRAAREGLHFWALVFVAVFSALLFVQSALYTAFDMTVDFREILTGSASRSAGVEEGTDGLRPTSLFEEPSNHAVIVFALTFLARITGPRYLWLTVLSTLSCLLNNSGIGLVLAVFLVVEEVSYQASIRRIGVPLMVAVIALIALAFLGYEASNVKLLAVEQVIRPQTRYDPVAVRLFVPNAIANFDPVQHLIGTGVSNYASFKDGITQYDSSFILGAYYQIGALGLVMMIYTLHRAWAVHSVRAAVMLLMLFITKISLLAPTFWAIAVLLDQRVALQPNTRAKRPMRLISLRLLSRFFSRARRRIGHWGQISKGLLLMTVVPAQQLQTNTGTVDEPVPFEDTQPAHFETTFFAPDSHSEPFPRRSSRPARHARRPHHSQLARRRR